MVWVHVILPAVLLEDFMSHAHIAASSANIARGMAFALAAYGSFATADAIIKLSSSRFSIFQIALFVAVFALIPALALTKGRGGLRALMPKKAGLVLTRAVMTSACCFLAWTAFGQLPLAECYALIFLAPLFVTTFSAVFLGEPVGWRRWASTLIGFAGVMIILNPQFATLHSAHILAGGAAILGALSFLLLRKIGSSEPSASILTSLLLALIAVSAIPAIQAWVQPTAEEVAMLALAGLLFGSGQAGLVFATRDAPAAIVAPFQYSQMTWAVLFGIFLFGDQPTTQLLIGLLIVAGSGLFTAWRETVRARPVTLASGRGEITARAARKHH